MAELSLKNGGKWKKSPVKWKLNTLFLADPHCTKWLRKSFRLKGENWKIQEGMKSTEKINVGINVSKSIFVKIFFFKVTSVTQILALFWEIWMSTFYSTLISIRKKELELPRSETKYSLKKYLAVKQCIIICIRACVPSCFSHVRLFVTLWTVACQAPQSIGLFR